MHSGFARGSLLITRPVTPDLRFVPQKYHKYILPTVRRVYLSQPQNQGIQQLRNTISALEDRLASFQTQNTTHKMRATSLEKRVASLAVDKERLMERCEGHMTIAKRMTEKERDACLALERAEITYQTIRRKYNELKAKYKTLKTA